MSFAAPIFLTALLAGLIPVLLHMVNRRKAPVLPFSTLRFIQHSVQQTRRRKIIHDATLLLLRIAALALIAIALAKPTINRLHGLLGRKASTAVVIILDNSASMGAADQSGPRWQRAQQAAEQLLDLVGDVDSAALLPTCGPPAPDAPRLHRRLETLRQSLASCKLSHERADLASALHRADKLLAESDVPNQEIYVITDRQAVSWEGFAAGARGDDPAAAPPVILVDVRGDPKPNVALRRVQLHSAAPVAGVPIQAAVELVGDARLKRQRHVELHLDGRKQEVSPTISIEPGGEAQHTFQFSLDQPGLHRGEVRLAGEDACPLDDRLYFAIDVNPHISVAIVRQATHEIEYLDDAFYLRRALAPEGGDEWAIRTELLAPADLASRPLSNFALIFCVNLAALDASAAQRLVDYVTAGGHVFWVSGDNVDPVAYSLMNDRVQGRLLPLRPTAVRRPPPERPDGWRIGWLDQGHPALQPLVKPASLYQSVLVHKYVEMAPAGDEDNIRTLARLDNGQPLLVERTVGAGAVMFLGTSLHVDWTNLPLKPIFLPLLARLTFYAADARAVQPQLVAGVPLTVPLNGRTDCVEVTLPSKNVERVDDVRRQKEFRYTQTHEVGIYQVRILEAARTRRLGFAYNLDPDETKSAVLTPDELAERFGQRRFLVCNQPEKLAETVGRLREGESLWSWFLTAVLLALVAESFVANRRQ